MQRGYQPHPHSTFSYEEVKHLGKRATVDTLTTQPVLCEHKTQAISIFRLFSLLSVAGHQHASEQRRRAV